MVKTTVPAIKGWEELTDLFDRQSYKDSTDTAYDLGAQDSRDAALISNGLHTWHIGETYTDDNGKSGT
mgnify:CR=1 FL=1